MRLLTSGVITMELLAANEAWWDHPLSLALAAVISGGVLLFIVKRVVGRRRPHEVTVADYWWTRDDGVLVTDSVPFGPRAGHNTYVMVQVKGRRLEGQRNLTNLTLKERPRYWQLWKLPGWRSGSTPLDLVGDPLTKLRSEGLSLGDSDSPLFTLTVVQSGQSGHYLLSSGWRVLPWAGRQCGVPRRLKRIEPDRSVAQAQPPGVV